MGRKKAGIYTRVSSEKQVEGTSLEVQEAVCLRLAEREGAEIVDVISDEGVSGAFYLSRPGIQRALGMLEDGRANMLITTKLDRTGRDVEIVRLIQKRVQAAGAQLMFADGMTFANNATGKLLLTQMAGFAEFERELIRERTMGGRRKRAEDGEQMARTFSPYGYHIVTKDDVLAGRYPAGTAGSYQIIEDRAATVRSIFQQYADGTSLRSICRNLNEQGLPTPRGSANWLHGTIRVMLKSTVYKGDAHFGKKESRADEGRVSSGMSARYVRDADPSTWVEIKAPPIVSEELWERCQKSLGEARARNAGNPKKMHLLTGLLRCPKCGLGLSGQWKRYSLRDGSDASEHFYQCRMSRPSQHTGKVVCSNQRYGAAMAEGMVIRAIEAIAGRPELVEAALKAYQRRSEESGEQPNVEELERRLREVTARERATVQAQIAGVMAGTDPAVYGAILGELAAEKESLQKQVGLLKRPVTQKRDPRSVARVMQRVAADVRDALTSEDLTTAEKRSLIAQVVEEIPVRWDIDDHWGLEVRLRKDAVGHFESGEPALNVEYISIRYPSGS